MTDELLTHHREMKAATSLKAGDALTNGAILLVQRKLLEVEGHIVYVVLAFTTQGYHPFVTWERVVTLKETDSPRPVVTDYCVSGHYFEELNDALLDYEERR